MRNLKYAALWLLSVSSAGHSADWRAMAGFGREIGFVDPASVERSKDGRVLFSGQFMLADVETFSDAGYDRYDVRASLDCQSGGKDRPRIGALGFYLKGQETKAPDWNEDDVEISIAEMGWLLCAGEIGHRSFASPEAAMAEHGKHHSTERLAAYVSDEVELMGIAVQGFEMNGISLCGSEFGCTPQAAREFCWMQSDVDIPLPDGADPQSIRRDTAGVKFRGRIYRSRSGRGFGHMNALGCEVVASGPSEYIGIPAAEQPSSATTGDRGRSAEATAAHQLFAQTFGGAGAVRVKQDGHEWSVDALVARPGDWQGACGSDLQYQGKSLDPYPTAIMWDNVLALDAAGPVLTVTSSRYDGVLDFHLATPIAAAALAARLDRLRSEPIDTIEQKGGKVVLRLENGKKLVETYPSAALAIEAAGKADALREKDVVSVSRHGNQVTALVAKRTSFTFEDPAKAAEIAGHMQRLRDLCTPASSSVAG